MDEDMIFGRRSIRKYRSQMPAFSQLEQVLLAGRAAPSGKNRQPWKFYVYGGEQKQALLSAMQAGLLRRKEEAGMDAAMRAGLADAMNTLRVMRAAPVLILVVYPQGSDPMQALGAQDHAGELVDVLSIGAAFQNMLLAARQQGLGSLWIANTFFAYPELMAQIKTAGTLMGAVALGYADEAPPARPRKPMEEIVEYRL